MAYFKETDEVGFDAEGFAVHKACGERVYEHWTIERDEEYHLNRDGSTTISSEGGDDKTAKGTWCEGCDERVTMEREAGKR